MMIPPGGVKNVLFNKIDVSLGHKNGMIIIKIYQYVSY